MRMRSLNSTELNALIFRNQKQNKTFNKTIDLLVQITKPSIYWLSTQIFGRFWLWESMYWLLRVGMTHTSWRYDRRGKHGCSCIYSCESRTLTFVVYRFDPSTNRGFRYMYAVSIVRGWRLGAGESVRAGIRCEGLSEEHEREEDAER